MDRTQTESRNSRYAPYALSRPSKHSNTKGNSITTDDEPLRVDVHSETTDCISSQDKEEMASAFDTLLETDFPCDSLDIMVPTVNLLTGMAQR